MSAHGAHVSDNEAVLGYFELLKKSKPSARVLEHIARREATIRLEMQSSLPAGGATTTAGAHPAPGKSKRRRRR